MYSLNSRYFTREILEFKISDQTLYGLLFPDPFHLCRLYVLALDNKNKNYNVMHQ